MLSTATATTTNEASPPGYPIDACSILAKTLPGNVNFPNSTMYIQENIYWSNRQAEVHPQCFVTPRKTADVSVIMKTLTALNAPFTVKSGGHTAYAGGSNIADGVTVDLIHLTDIIVSKDHQTVSVGPGNRWINVSQALDPLKLAVVAGRVSDVGVGGLILGGGISYFSGSRGWACDNVRNFEVVLASGQVVNASPTQNTDLFWGLRGGAGANFGIVTRFDLVAFPQGDLWSQSIIFPGAANKTLIPLFTDLAQKGLVQDPKAHTYFVQAYTAQFGGFITLGSFFHAQPPPKDTVPAVFQPFQSVHGALLNSTQVVNISTQSIAINEPYGLRQTWWDTSVSMSSSDFLEEITSLWQQFVLGTVHAANGSSFLPF
ncbi:FAD-dependent monooxygenase prx3 [Cladobotryum mycophilum]|uniref:FAD-dependent monooxygenase prx3 n=1 Tax=Cladobotryum mycophilum TaxID=491253 RepID=A0ABR0SCE2_9HYPO